MLTAAEQFMPGLIRTLRSYAPTVTADTDAQGRESSILTIRNPRDSRWSLQFICPNQPDRRGELYGSLWFGGSRSPVTCPPGKPAIPYRRYCTAR